MRPFEQLLRRSRCVPVLLSACLCAPAAALAQQKQPEAQKQQQNQPAPAADAPQQTVTRVYDVRDLLVVLRNYPFRGAMMSARQSQPVMPLVGVLQARGRGPTTAPASPAEPAEESQAEREDVLTRLITDTVAPESWRDNGGDTGSMRVMNGQLIVTQTKENQAQLQQLLAQLRETRGKMVRVRAHWLLLSPAEAEKILAPAGGGRQDESAVVQVDPAALRSLPASVVRYNAQTLGFNGQTVHVVSGPARTVVSDVDVQVGTGAVGFDPVVELVRSGLLLEVAPLVATGDKRVTLDLYSAFVDAPRDATPLPVASLAATRPSRAASATAGEDAGGEGTVLAEGVIDRLRTTMQELRTTVQIPLNRPVLIGGMTLNPGLPGQNAQPFPALYLVIEVVASE